MNLQPSLCATCAHLALRAHDGQAYCLRHHHAVDPDNDYCSRHESPPDKCANCRHHKPHGSVMEPCLTCNGRANHEP